VTPVGKRITGGWRKIGRSSIWIILGSSGDGRKLEMAEFEVA
jgi:hypothetical protein